MTRPYNQQSTRALFEPTKAEAMKLKNRTVMTLMTCNCAGPDLVSGVFTAEYYAKCTSLRSIITDRKSVV